MSNLSRQILKVLSQPAVTVKLSPVLPLPLMRAVLRPAPSSSSRQRPADSASVTSTLAALKASVRARSPATVVKPPDPVAIDLEQQVLALLRRHLVLACCEMRAIKKAAQRATQSQTQSSSPIYCRITNLGTRLFGNAPFDRFPQQHAVSRGHPEQFGRPPDEVGLEFVHDPVGHYDFPQHFDNTLAAVLVQLATKNAGETVNIGRLVLLSFCFSQQKSNFIAVKIKSLLQYGIEFPTFLWIESTIDHRPANEQRRRCQPQFLFTKISGSRLFSAYALNDRLEIDP